MDTDEITESQVIAWFEKQGHELMRRCDSPSAVVSLNVFVGERRGLSGGWSQFCVHASDLCAGGPTLDRAIGALRYKVAAREVVANGVEAST
jgi:hypothetical protein